MFGKKNKFRSNLNKNLSDKGFLSKTLDKFSSPINRYSSLIANVTTAMREGGGLHGNSKYFNSAYKDKYIRLQVIASTDSYIEINASLVLISDALNDSEKIGFSALNKKLPNQMIGILRTHQEILDFLDEIWDKWYYGDKEIVIGSKWKKVDGGYIRVQDSKFLSSTYVKEDGGGWLVYEKGDEFITLHINDIK